MAVDPRQQLKPVVMEGVKIIFRNFKGEEGQYNREGVRTFGVIIPDKAIAEAMQADGWNVKYLKPSEEEQEQGLEEGPPWLPVEAAFDKGKPPKIMLITERGKTALDENTVDMLDWADIAVNEETGEPKVDLIVRPYFWTNAMGNNGVKAYLKSMFVTIEEDDLEKKYAEMDQQ